MRVSLVKAATVASAALLLASCAMPADDPNFDANQGSDVVGAVEVDASLLDTAMAAPTSIGSDVPLAATPESGLTIVSITDGSEYEGVFQTALAEAGAALGWTVETVTADEADPTTAATAFDEAVAKSASGIHITGEFYDALVASLPAAEAAGIPVICTGCSTGAPVDDAAAAEAAALEEGATAAATEAAVSEAATSAAAEAATETGSIVLEGIADASIDGTMQNIEWANILSTYVVTSQYDGEDAGVQIFTEPGGALVDFNTQFATKLVDQCRNCSATESFVDPMMVDKTDPTALPTFVGGEMTIALGAWALMDSGEFSAGVAEALAGDPTLLAPITVIGRGASAADIAILQGLGGAAAPAGDATAAATEAAATEAAATDGATEGATEMTGRTPEEAAALQAWIAIPQPVMAWRVIDQFARVIAGEAPATGPLPSQLLTGANAGDAVLDENGNYIGIADYKEQFATLWGVKK